MAPARQSLDSIVLEYLQAVDVCSEVLTKVREELRLPDPSAALPECQLTRMSAYAADGAMEVAVSRLSGETDRFEVFQWTSVQDLKTEIEARMQIPMAEQVLLKNGRELKGNDDCLAVHRITFTNAALEVIRSETREVPREEQSLTISFKTAEGIPDGSILSIRAGTKGRQMPLKFDEPFRLPTTKEASSSFKIDIFAQFGKARLTLRPGKYEYTAQIQSPEGLPLGSIDFEARDTSEREKGQQPAAVPRAAAGPSRRAQATVLASSYLDQHGLIQYLQGLLQSILREKPADPYQYMIQQLQAAQLAPQPGSDVRSAAAAEGSVQGSAEGAASS
mmetsp:Transcript_101757/g.270717  ORF Transcript_101757/g.270717 Transcript_101757/m.270717 type:complete len:334 (-) Transcript_101757:113-1114(-)